MPKCMHRGHQTSSVRYRREGKKTIMVEVLVGWNPVYRRHEICDDGFVEKRKRRVWTEEGKS